MQLGLVSYQIAAEWDLTTLLTNCRELGIAGVELRTTHAHGVEPTLSKSQRADVKAKFEDADIILWGLGTVCEFDAVDPVVVQEHIDECRRFIELAADVGARGVKVRPNKLHEDEGVPKDKTLEQIGKAYAKCGKIGADHNVELWMEVHGQDTCLPDNMRVIMNHADHGNCFVCWNSNMTDRDAAGSIDDNFALLARWVRSVHITDLSNRDYPWRRLFELLDGNGYGQRLTLAEIAGTDDPARVMTYYRALWLELSNQ
ncbi:MAG: xylose isomerase [Phycisphaerae bacterium]|nr:xylose isomerase [Phycisphaerae bacterium]